MMKSINFKLISLILASKIIVFLIIFLAYNLLPFNKIAHDINPHFPKNENITLQTAYKTWDAQHYLFLSENGFNKGQISNAFAPLFPTIISIINLFINNNVIAGLLVANTFSIIGIYFFYKLVDLLYGSKIAFSSTFFLLIFPTSFYFSLIYSEGIFFALVTSSFYYLFKKKYGFVSILAFFIPMARTVGIFIIIPYIFFYIFEERRFNFNSQVIDILKSFFSKKFIFLLSPLFGLLSYFAYMFLRTGNYLEMLTASSHFVSSPTISYLWHPFELFSILSSNLHIHGFSNSIIDRIFILFAIVMFYFVYKKTNFTFFIYCITIFMPFILIGNIMSSTRHILMIFPIFFTLAIIFKNPKYNFIKHCLIYLMISIQTLFLIMHALNYWVA